MRYVTYLLTLVLATLAFAPATATARHAQLPTKSVGVALPRALTQGGTTPSLSVYPNPGRGQVSVQLAASTGPDYKFRLSNVLGREVRLLVLRPELSADGLALDLSNLPAGLYFYSLLVNDRVVSTNRLTLQ